MHYIDIYDYLLLVLYVFFFSFLLLLKSKKYEQDKLKKFFINGFFLHVAGSILYCMVIQYYYGYGDSFGFYQGSNFLRKVISTTENPLGPFFLSGNDFEKVFGKISDNELSLPTGIGINSNLVIMKISAALSYLSFNSYLIISLFFGLFTFAGLWNLFLMFNEIMEKKNQRILAIVLLYTPSICFWGSGLIKDSICLGLLGFICSFVYTLFIRKKFSIIKSLLLILFLYLLLVIKTYLAIALLLSLALTAVVNLIIKRKNNVLKLVSISLIIFTTLTIVIISSSSSFNSILEETKSNIETFKGAYANPDGDEERSMAEFSTAFVDVNLPNLILRAPLAFFTTLFRPFLWESRKPIVFFSALESFLTLLATVYLLIKCKVSRFFYFIFTDPYLFLCFTFTILLGVIIGFTTFNFGTLVRYRLPILPFYFFMLLSIHTKNKELQVLKNRFQ